MNGREGVCVGVEETRLLIKLEGEKGKTVKVKHKNVEWFLDPSEESVDVEDASGMAQVVMAMFLFPQVLTDTPS